MSNKKGFEQLAQELPDDERKDLLKEIQDDLKKLHKTDTFKKKFNSEEDIFLKDKLNLEKIYQEISLFEKIKIILAKIFTRKSMEVLIEEYLIQKIGKSIDHDYPGLIDQKGKYFKERFYNEINILQNCMDIFTEPLNNINKYSLTGFYQAIASSEMSEFEESLKRVTDPESVAKENEKYDYEKIRYHINKKMNDLISSIETEEKNRVYDVVKMYYLLNQLSDFPFSTIKKSFVSGPGGSRTCMFVNCRKQLSQLNNILYNLSTYDTSRYKTLLKYVFEYHYSNIEEYKEEDPDSLSKSMEKAQNSISMITNFHKTVPMLKILKYMYKNLDYVPDPISGGEDWFTVYKKYLKETTEKRTEKYIFNQKKNELIKKLSGFIPEISDAKNYSVKININEKYYEIPQAVIFYYLFLFYEKYYMPKIEPAVSKILLHGLFYKESNKKELTEAFDFMRSFKSDYNALLNKTNPDGERIKELCQLILEDKKISIRMKKINNFINSVSSETQKLYTEYYTAFRTISSVIGGVVSGSASKTYDTLSNLSDICENKTSMSIKSIDRIYRNMCDILNTFKEFDELTIHKEI